jgi:hypothetical protein
MKTDTHLAEQQREQYREMLINEIRAAHAAKYERPSCDEDCDDECCGSPRHYDQTFNDATGEWEDD